MPAGWFPPDVRRDEDEHFTDDVTLYPWQEDILAGLEAYSMSDADAADQEDFRARLGNGLVLSGQTPHPRRFIESVKFIDPVTGERREL